MAEAETSTTPALPQSIMADFTTLTVVSPVLTNERISEALSEWFHEEMVFDRWEYVSETGKGDSFFSELIRIDIFGRNNNGDVKSVRVILKTVPRNTCRRLTFRNDEFFKNEISFYQKVLPVLLGFQAGKNMCCPLNCFTKLFYAYSDGVHDAICLEDASLENYGSAVRQEGIDMNHTKLSLECLAKLHAMSFALRDQQPEIFQKIRNEVFETYYATRLWPWYEKFWKRLCAIAIDAVEQEYPDSIYEQKIREFCVPETYERMVDAANNTKENGVFSHGDSWTNNFLYRYEGGTPVAAKIIDFQLTRVATPVLDVSFMMCVCVDHKLRQNHYLDLLKLYHNELSKQIRDMGSDPEKLYSWDVFMDETKKYSFFGLGYSLESTTFIVLAPEDAIDLDVEGDEIMNIDDIYNMQPFKTKEGRLREANNIVHAVDNGHI